MQTILLACGVLSVSAISVVLPSRGAEGGASQWVQWTSAGGQRFSVWDNAVQVEDEKKNPPSHGDPQPFGVETRWLLDGLVSNVPEGWHLMFLEIGETDLCFPYECEGSLFALETINDKDALLHTYNVYNDDVKSAVKKLHDDPQVKETLLDFTKLASNPVKVYFKYGFNETEKATVFYGEGGGAFPFGGSFSVQEIVKEGETKPLEKYIDDNGVVQTKYEVPKIFKPRASKVFGASSTRSSWPSNAEWASFVGSDASAPQQGSASPESPKADGTAPWTYTDGNFGCLETSSNYASLWLVMKASSTDASSEASRKILSGKTCASQGYTSQNHELEKLPWLIRAAFNGVTAWKQPTANPSDS